MKFGWVRDQPDFRDHFRRHFVATRGRLSPRADLRPHCPPIYDQGNLGSCTGNAVAAVVGVCPMPKPTESVEGGHAVVLVGYDDPKKAFLVRNSWGDAWGMRGYFWMPYAYVLNADLAADFWTITQVQ